MADSYVSIFDISILPEIEMLGQTERTGFWGQSPRVAPSHMLVFVVEGGAVFLFQGETIALQAGEVLYISKGQVYQAKADPGEGCRFYFLHFQPASGVRSLSPETAREEVEQFYQALQDGPSQDVSSMPQAPFSRVLLLRKTPCEDLRDEVISLLEKAVAERDHFSLNSRMMISFFCGLLFGLLTRLALKTLSGSNPILYDQSTHPLVQVTLRYIRRHYKEPLTLPLLCHAAGVSPQYLIRVFQKHLGMTPLQYINRLRITYAKDLIRFSHLSLKEIAYDIGLENPHYFSRLFRKLEGMSPMDYKKSLGSPLSYS